MTEAKGLSGLLKYRFTKKPVAKIASRSDSQDSNSQSSVGSTGDGSSNTSTVINGCTENGRQTPVKNQNGATCVPDTPESQRPASKSPTFTTTKASIKELNTDSKISSPWLTTNKEQVKNGFSIKTNRNRILSDSESEGSQTPTKQHSSNADVEFQNKLRTLQSMFPTAPTEKLEKTIRNTSNVDDAINAMMGIPKGDVPVKKSRKRIRNISSGSDDSDIVPRQKKVKPIEDSQNNLDGVSAEEQSQIDQTEGLEEKVKFLSEAFPLLKRPVLEKTLRAHNYDVEDATEAISTGNIPEDTVTSPTLNAGSIKAIQAARMSNKLKSRMHDQEDSDEEESFVTIHKSRRKQKPLEYAAGLADGEDAYEDDDAYDSEDSESEFLTSDQSSILSFFNEATLEELQTMPGCSKKKASVLMEIRPFDTWEDMVTKVNESRQLSFNLISGCKEMIKIREVVIKLMIKCEKISKDMEKIVSGVVNATTLEEGQGHIAEQPKSLNEKFELKPFQMVGLNWLMLMHRQELNGILADEMGLGKTIQSIAFLAQLMEEEEPGPHVIIVPSSTIDNWLRELKLWCPSIKVILYYGSQEERKELRYNALEGDEPFDVMVTTYNMATGSLEDRVMFKKIRFNYAIFDEAHMLKNMGSLRYQNLMKVRSKRRILLTGTPLQNNLVELMSLLCFVMPEMFIGKTDHLKKMFTMITQKSDNGARSNYEAETITRAKSIMKPFILRRLKTEVLKQLPKKTEHTEKCAMAFEQQDLYDELVQKFSDAMKDENRAPNDGLAGAAMLMQLRKAANHHLLHRRQFDESRLQQMSQLMLQEPTHCEANPHLIQEDMEVMSDFELHNLCKIYKSISQFKLDTEQITDSGKFRYLDELLPARKEQGDRVLLFSQFTMMMDIIEVYLKSRGYKYYRLDGQTPVVERQDLIDKFNNDTSVFIFMLSTRAGGLGINLTSANVVIIHDIDFNPYNDKQAEDRSHRVGQTRDVNVYKLISKNSVEEGMLRCAQEKLKLEQDVTSKPSKSKKSSKEENPSDVAFLLKEALGVNH